MAKPKPTPPSEHAQRVAEEIAAVLFGKHFIQRTEEIAPIIDKALAEAANERAGDQVEVRHG